MYRRNKSRNNKISPEFAVRLDSLGSQQKIRAIVLLSAKNNGRAIAQRQSSAERQAAIEAIRKSAEEALGDFDYILERFSGQRLAKRPDALGSISIETTAAGIHALAESEWVKAILEDQKIYPILRSSDYELSNPHTSK